MHRKYQIDCTTAHNLFLMCFTVLAPLCGLFAIKSNFFSLLVLFYSKRNTQSEREREERRKKNWCRTIHNGVSSFCSFPFVGAKFIFNVCSAQIEEKTKFTHAMYGRVCSIEDVSECTISQM